MLEVELTVTETVEVDETVEMKALVTQGDEKIEDADEVVFEVWEEGKKSESEMIDSVNEKDGIYTAETSFDHDGFSMFKYMLLQGTAYDAIERSCCWGWRRI